MDELLFGGGVIAVFAFFALYLYSLRYIFQFAIEDRELVIKLFGIVRIRRVPISDIERAEIVSWRSLLPGQDSFQIGYIFAERWPGYLGLRGLGIKKRHGLSRWIVISPKDPERMLELVNDQRPQNRR